MKKKITICLVMSVLVCGVLLAQVDERVWTDDGFYNAKITYLGNKPGGGSIIFSEVTKDMQTKAITLLTNIKLTKGQWQAVNQMLNKYAHSRGDIFFITISPDRTRSYAIYVEYTSTTQYIYWTLYVIP
ncbi:hypothetical protein FACS1894130_11410 [Spirochaetia bacterium]|nr:hypothetical protein FACS1894130_11410 [Spirochaetia bacterium]